MEYKKIKKSSKIFFSFLVLLFSLLFPISCFAYEIPQDSYYVNVTTQELGEVVIYFPYNNARYLSWNEDQNELINTYSSQVTAYAYNGSWYTVRFPTFDIPNFRITDSSYNYDDLHIISLNETNITFLNDTDFTAFSSGNLANLATLLIGGCILICLFMRR